MRYWFYVIGKYRKNTSPESLNNYLDSNKMIP